MDHVRGITYSRLFALGDLRAERHREELHDFGKVAAMAYHDPESLKQLSSDHKPLNLEEVHPMLRPAPPPD